MTVTITITADTAAQARAEAAILAVGDTRQEPQAPAVTSPREATTYGPHLAFFGAERDALADALGVGGLDRTDPARYVEEAKVIKLERKLISEAMGTITESLGLPPGASPLAIATAVMDLKLECKRLTDALGVTQAPPWRSPRRPRKVAEPAMVAEEAGQPEEATEDPASPIGSIDWWIARVKGVTPFASDLSDLAVLTSVANALFDGSVSPSVVREKLSNRMGLRDFEINNLLRPTSAWRNSVEINTCAVVRELVMMFQPHLKGSSDADHQEA